MPALTAPSIFVKSCFSARANFLEIVGKIIKFLITVSYFLSSAWAWHCNCIRYRLQYHCLQMTEMQFAWDHYVWFSQGVHEHSGGSRVRESAWLPRELAYRTNSFVYSLRVGIFENLPGSQHGRKLAEQSLYWFERKLFLYLHAMRLSQLL